MKISTLSLVAASVALGGFSTAHAADTQIGDFRIGSADASPETTFDPGFTGFNSRSVVGAPVNITSEFSGGSQQANGTTDGEDVRLRTFSSQTNITNLSRFNPSPNGSTGGPVRAGMVQWNFDLLALDSYLSDNDLALTELDLDLNTQQGGGDDPTYDVYLSYTNPAEGIMLTPIDSTTVGTGSGDDGAGGINYAAFVVPAIGASEGDVVGGTHKVLAAAATGDQDFNVDLLSLYESGVREFNLQIAATGFFSSRTIGILDGSGLSISTIAAPPIPEPASALLIGAGATLLLRRRRQQA